MPSMSRRSFVQRASGVMAGAAIAPTAAVGLLSAMSDSTTRYRLSVDLAGPDPWPAGGMARVVLSDGREAWVEAAALAPHLVRLDVPAPTPPPAGTVFGAWFAGNEPASDYVAARAAGLTWARVRWFAVGADMAGQIAWARDSVARARAAGLRVIFEYWAWSAPLAAGQRGDLPTVSLADWSALSDALAGALGPDVDAVQPGNEPDIATADMTPRWPEYVSVAARSWRRARPGLTVVAPGMAMMPYAGARTADWARLRECAADVSALAVHCYAEDLARSWVGGGGLSGQIATLSQAAGWSGPVWLTECGGISAPVTRWQSRRSETQQVVDTTATVQAARAAGVPVACIYSWRDQPGQEQRHGLCREDGTPKPALAALKAALG